MKRNRFLIVVVGILCFSLGILFGCLLPSWCRIGPFFFDIKLIEIIQLCVTILIAITVSYFITGGIGRDLKKRDLISDLVSRIQSSLSETLGLSYEYINKPDKEREKKVIINFKNLSMLLGIMSDVRKSDEKLLDYDESLHGDFLKFKEAVTDTPFGQRKPVYSSDRIDKVQERFNVMSKRLQECKMKLYS